MKKRRLILHIEEIIRPGQDSINLPELRKTVLDYHWPMPAEIYVELPASMSRPDTANPTRLRITAVEEIIDTPKKDKPVEYPEHHHTYKYGKRCPICLTPDVTAHATADAKPITVKRGKTE